MLRGYRRLAFAENSLPYFGRTSTAVNVQPLMRAGANNANGRLSTIVSLVGCPIEYT